MEQIKKLKVAMICHFSNKEVREHLPLSKHIMYRVVRKLFRMPGKRNGYDDIAPWDTNFIKSAKERNDIELFVISAHHGLEKSLVQFDSDGIHYYFLPCEVSTMLKKLIHSDKLWRRLNPLAPRIVKIVNTIKPDLVVLFGTENAYYSSSVLSITDYPVYVLCQTVYNNPEFQSTGKWDSKNATTEKEIVESAQYIGVYCQKHYDLLRQLGYQNYIFEFNWPISGDKGFVPTPCERKEYDFVNYALHMCDEKGFFDCIKALAIVKQKYPDVRLCLVDGGSDDVRKELKVLINDLSLEDNVTFIPFFQERNDLFQFLQKVRFAVLPCKVDHISGTQLQAMKYGLPLVCYKTTGTPLLNKDRECVLIAEKNDVEQLAEKMIELMDNPALANKLRENSFENTRERIAKSHANMEQLVDNFKAIIDNYNNDTPIPANQLFNSTNKK